LGSGPAYASVTMWPAESELDRDRMLAAVTAARLAMASMRQGTSAPGARSRADQKPQARTALVSELTPTMKLVSAQNLM